MGRSPSIPTSSRSSSGSFAPLPRRSDGVSLLRKPERHSRRSVGLHMKKLTYIAAIAFAALPVTSRAQSADAIIDRAVAAYGRLNSMRADFRQTLTNPLTGSTQTTSGVILRKKPNLLSITFDGGDRVVADGSTLWAYLPSSVPGQVMRMPYSMTSA